MYEISRFVERILPLVLAPKHLAAGVGAVAADVVTECTLYRTLPLSAIHLSSSHWCLLILLIFTPAGQCAIHGFVTTKQTRHSLGHVFTLRRGWALPLGKSPAIAPVMKDSAPPCLAALRARAKLCWTLPLLLRAPRCLPPSLWPVLLHLQLWRQPADPAARAVGEVGLLARPPI